MIDTSKIGGMLAVIKSGKGFKNYASADITTLTRISIPDESTLYARAVTQAQQFGLPVPTLASITTARKAIIDSYTQATTFATHVSSMSLINPMGEPNFVGMARIAQAARDIDGQSACTLVNNVFGSIQRAAEYTEKIKNYATDVQQFLENIPKYIATIPSRAKDFTAALSNQVTSDVNALAKAKLSVAQYSIAANLTSIHNDECLSNVLATIMTDKLKAEVDKASEALKAKVLHSIYDEDASTIQQNATLDTGSPTGSAYNNGAYANYVSTTGPAHEFPYYNVFRYNQDISNGPGMHVDYRGFGLSGPALEYDVYFPVTQEMFIDRIRFACLGGAQTINLNSDTINLQFPTENEAAAGSAIITTITSTKQYYTKPLSPSVMHTIPDDYNDGPTDGLLFTKNLMFYSSDYPTSRFVNAGYISTSYFNNFNNFYVFYELKEGEWEDSVSDFAVKNMHITLLSGEYSIYPNWVDANNKGTAVPIPVEVMSNLKPYKHIYNWVYYEDHLL